MLAEQALHGARRGGMWAAGSHLVMVAWVATRREDADGELKPLHGPDDDDANGVRLFARAITAHTVRDGQPDADRARLLTPDWRREVEARGWDSVVECARAFERVLHARNVLAQLAALADVRELGARHTRPRVPAVLASGIERHRAAAKATGPGRFDKASVASLDTATDVAMLRFRERVQEAHAHDGILVCSTGVRARRGRWPCVAVPCDRRATWRTSARCASPGEHCAERAGERNARELLGRLARFGSQGA